MKVRYIKKADGYLNIGLTLGNIYQATFKSKVYELIDDRGKTTLCFPFEVEVINEDTESIKDPIVQLVIDQFKERSKKGIETYGTTLQENNLSTLEWINEAQAEAMDFCLYLEKLKDKIKEYDNERKDTN